MVICGLHRLRLAWGEVEGLLCWVLANPPYIISVVIRLSRCGWGPICSSDNSVWEVGTRAKRWRSWRWHCLPTRWLSSTPKWLHKALRKPCGQPQGQPVPDCRWSCRNWLASERQCVKAKASWTGAGQVGALSNADASKDILVPHHSPSGPRTGSHWSSCKTILQANPKHHKGMAETVPRIWLVWSWSGIWKSCVTLLCAMS